MTNSPEAIEREEVLEQINSSAQQLTSVALWNVDKPFETPVRWHESRFSSVTESPDFDLWMRLGERSVTLSLQLDVSEQNEEILRRRFGYVRDGALWRLCVSEGNIPDTDDSGSMRALLTIPREGPIDIDHARWCKNDEGEGTAIFKGDDYLETLGERPGVKKYLLDTLSEIVEVAPGQQLQFIEEMVATWRVDPDEYLRQNSVRVLGSLAARNKLSELGIEF